VIDRLAKAVATGLGAGLAPKAPGTLGALEGVVLFFGLLALSSGWINRSSPAPFALMTIANLIVFAVGVWSSSRVCRSTGINDPQTIVVDEISGQLIALLPLSARPSIAGVIAAFVLFRLLDILKPYPISRLERLHGGLGVMADDALAGVLGAALVWLGRHAGLL
jgi:phosphatidylglycerophosphatase A